MPIESAYVERLTSSLVLRNPASRSDLERIAAFDGVIHGPAVARMAYNLFTHHPHIEYEDIIYVEDEPTGAVVSSLCLIPRVWRLGGVELLSGEMGIVGTLEPYLRQGLVRAQVAYFKRRLAERGCLLSHIQGIPYYYRQFGYEYALPLEGGLRLELRHIPESPSPRFKFRLAGLTDIPTLDRLYREAVAKLDISVIRSEAVWKYMLAHTDGTDTAAQTWIIEGSDAAAAGYLRVPHHHFGPELTVNEVSSLPFEAALAALQHLKGLASKREKPALRLNLPASSTLLRLAQSLGTHAHSTYAWQIHIPDMVALLRALKPALERRLADSPFSGTTHDLCLSLYREAIRLRFDQGQLLQIERIEVTGNEDVHFPPPAFVQLVLGYRSRDELSAAYPDARVAPVWRLLVDILFPRMSSFLYTIY